MNKRVILFNSMVILIELTMLFVISCSQTKVASQVYATHASSLPPEIDSSYSLTWSDEFTGTQLDTTKWISPSMSGTSMDQGSQAWVTPGNTGDNVDHAWLEANNKPLNGMPYTAGQITTLNKKLFRYGYFEISEQFPYGPGLWGASWLVNATNSNHSEIDFPEVLGKDNSTAYFTYHRPDGSQQQFIAHNIDWSTGYHRFGMKWTTTAISFYLDDVLVGTATGTISSDQMDLKLNLDVGDSSSWAGAPNSSTYFPSYQSIDYVRVYQTASC